LRPTYTGKRCRTCERSQGGDHGQDCSARMSWQAAPQASGTAAAVAAEAYPVGPTALDDDLMSLDDDLMSQDDFLNAYDSERGAISESSQEEPVWLDALRSTGSRPDVLSWQALLASTSGEVILIFRFPDGKQALASFKPTQSSFDIYAKAFELGGKNEPSSMLLFGPRSAPTMIQKDLHEGTWSVDIFNIGLVPGSIYDVVVEHL